MAWMRAVAGANLITSFRVIYQLVGLTTTGASTATAYAPFSFVLSGSGNRVPPATINVFSDGLLLTVGVDYSYNSATGSVTIYRVAGDIVVEAVGKIGTIIYSPAAGYNIFAIVRDIQNDQKYYVYWFSSIPSNEWKPYDGNADTTLASIIVVTPNIVVRGPMYCTSGYSSLDDAIYALYAGARYNYYNQNSYRTVITGEGRSGTYSATASIGGKWPYVLAATNATTPLYAMTDYTVTVSRSGSSSQKTYASSPSVPETTVEYDRIVVQS